MSKALKPEKEGKCEVSQSVTNKTDYQKSVPERYKLYKNSTQQ